MNRYPRILLLSLSLLTGLPAQEPPSPDVPGTLQADPANDLFTAAQLAYSEATHHKDQQAARIAFESALRTFRRFAETFPTDPRATEARFYIASCYEKLGQDEKALNSFASLAKTNARGPLAEAAALKTANHYYQSGSYAKAETFFARAAQLATKPENRHLALYNRALSLQHLEDRTDELKEALRDVVFDKGSPYSEKARVAISALYARSGDKERAYANYKILARSENPGIAAEATLQCAILARDLKKTVEANHWFEQILADPRLTKWHGKAQLTLMAEAYTRKDHQRVLDLLAKGNFQLNKEEEAQRIQMAAEAHRALGHDDAANELYARLAKVSPHQDQAFEAGYAVLTRQYKTSDKNFLPAARNFLRKHSAGHADDPRLDNARLMLAEKLFAARDFRSAAQEYSAINLNRISTENLPGLRYRLAYSKLKAGREAEAMEDFTNFLSKHADDSLAPRALAHRASLHSKSGAWEPAAADYETLLAKATSPDLRLQALSGLADIYRKQENLPRLIEVHRQLLDDFPNRSAADRSVSHFVTGWAYFKQDRHEDALPNFEKARELNPGKLGRDATLHLALIHFANQDENKLKPELDRLLNDFPDSKIPPTVSAWLGARLASKNQFTEAWSYLSAAVTPASPEKTKTAVWKAYSKTAVALGHHREALLSTKFLLPKEESPYLQAVLLHRKAKAELGLGQFPQASASAKQALELKPQGELNASLRITLGDIALAESKPDDALAHYVVVAELIGKEETKLEAIKKALAIYESKDDDASRQEAERYRKLLQAH